MTTNSDRILLLALGASCLIVCISPEGGFIPLIIIVSAYIALPFIDHLYNRLKKEENHE